MDETSLKPVVTETCSQDHRTVSPLLGLWKHHIPVSVFPLFILTSACLCIGREREVRSMRAGIVIYSDPCWISSSETSARHTGGTQ